MFGLVCVMMANYITEAERNRLGDVCRRELLRQPHQHPKLLSSFRIAVHMYGHTDHIFRTLCFVMCTTYIMSVLEHVIRNILVFFKHTLRECCRVLGVLLLNAGDSQT